MRRFLALSGVVALAALAVAGGEGSEHKTVTVKKSTVTHVSAHGADIAFRPIPVQYSRSLLCSIRRSERLDKWLEEIVNLSLDSVHTMNKEDVSVSYIELCPEDGCAPALGQVQGDEMFYPSGVARLFYAAALYNKLGSHGGNLSPQMKNDIMLALRDGSNSATNRLIGYLADSRGPEYTNWYLSNLGFKNFNVNQPFITGDPTEDQHRSLGRKLNLNYENSNRVTADQAATLLYLLDKDALVSPGASQAMKAYMFHPLEQRKLGPLEGIAAGLPVGSTIITINGYTGRNYNEAALVKLSNGKRFILSINTKYNQYPTYFIPLVSRTIAFRLMTSTGQEDPGQHRYIPTLAGATH